MREGAAAAPDGGGPRSMSRRWLLGVAIVALLVRLGFAIAVHDTSSPVGTLASHLLGDERAYDAFARQVAAGTLDRERAFYQEPLYAWLLGQVYRLAPPPPVDPETAAIVHAPVHRAVILAQHAFGVLTAVLVAALGARCLGRGAGVLAGLFAALSGPLVFTESMLLKESLGLALWVATLHLWLDVLLDGGGRVGSRAGSRVGSGAESRARSRAGPRARAVLLGLLLGVGILLRGNTYLLAGIIGLSFLARVGGRRRVAEAALAALATLVAISPATLHNLRRGDWVLTTYQAGTNAAIGQPDSPLGWRGVQYDPLLLTRGDALYEEQDAVALAEAAEGRPLASREVSAFWWRRAWEHAAARPGVALERVGRKLLHVFHGDEVPDVKDWHFFGSEVRWLGTPLSDLRWIGPLALLGFLLLPWRPREMLVLRGALLAVMLSLALFYVMGRYRLSAAPVLWILAAGALAGGWREIVAKPRGGAGPFARGRLARKAGLVVLAAAAVGAGRIPIRPDAFGLQVSWSNLASVELVRMRLAAEPETAERRREAAVAAARQALAIAPLFPDARQKLVRALEMQTPHLEPRAEEAADQAWRLLLVVEGERAGKVVVPHLDRPLESVVGVVRTLREQPSAPGAEEPIAAILAYASRRVAQELRHPAAVDLALDLIDQSLRLEPSATIAWSLRGRALSRVGRLGEAEEAYRRALALGEESVELRNNLGNLLVATGRAEEALDHLRRALELAPGNVKVLDNLERATRAAREAAEPGATDGGGDSGDIDATAEDGGG